MLACKFAKFFIRQLLACSPSLCLSLSPEHGTVKTLTVSGLAWSGFNHVNNCKLHLQRAAG